MYNLRSSNKDTVQFPVQIEIADDNQILKDLLHHKATSLSTEAICRIRMKHQIVTLIVML